MKVYFDLCVYNRPFDDQTQPRVMIESLAVVAIMALVNAGQIQSINSFALDYENRKNPRPANRSFIENLPAEAVESVHHDDGLTQRALELEKRDMPCMLLVPKEPRLTIL